MPSLQELANAAFAEEEARAYRRARASGEALTPRLLIEKGPPDGVLDLTVDVATHSPVKLAQPRTVAPAPPPPVVIPPVEGRRMVCGEPGCPWFIASNSPVAAARARRVHRKDIHGIGGRVGRLIKDPERRRRKIARGQARAWRAAKRAAQTAGEEATPAAPPMP